MLTTAEIKKFIADDAASERKKQAAVGQRYYESEHDILKYRLFYYNENKVLTEDKFRSNVKICHPFFTVLSDQLTAFMLSFKESPIQAKETANGLQEKLDEYFDDEFWAEISDVISGCYNKGFEYIYAYKRSPENRLVFQCADSMGVCEVDGKETEDGKSYVIYRYTDRLKGNSESVNRIQVWSDKDVSFFIQNSSSGEIERDSTEKVNPRPHVVYTDDKTGQKMGYPLNFIPFWRLDFNKKQVSGLKPIKAIIDDFDLMQCGLSNNLKDFDTPLHVVKGFEGAEEEVNELFQNLKTKKMVITDGEGGIDIKTVDIPYEARKVKADEDRTSIYTFGMGFNPAQTGDGNITNVVIKSRYFLLEMKANKLEKQLRKMLKKIVKVVLDEINRETQKGYEISDVEFNLERSIMTNESENAANEKVKAETEQIKINTILNAAAQLGEEQALKAICEVMDLDFEELKGQLERDNPDGDLAAAKSALEVNVAK